MESVIRKCLYEKPSRPSLDVNFYEGIRLNFDFIKSTKMKSRHVRRLFIFKTTEFKSFKKTKSRGFRSPILRDPRPHIALQ